VNYEKYVAWKSCHLRKRKSGVESDGPSIPDLRKGLKNGIWKI
jgi:hypothetical protein